MSVVACCRWGTVLENERRLHLLVSKFVHVEFRPRRKVPLMRLRTES